jgi:uncharacterized glyoxalase superfamily protein PhnB
MDERELIEQLDRAVEAAVAGYGEAPATGDLRLAGLARLATMLHGLPHPHFRDGLKRELTEKSTMTATHIPKGFRSVTPYLVVRGVARLIEFLSEAFDGEEVARFPRPDGSIMHAAVRVGDSMIEMGEPTPEHADSPAALHLYVPDADAAYRRALEAGGVMLYAPTDQPYGDREAGVRDPAGNQWYIATHQAGESYIMPGLGSVTVCLHPVGADKLVDFLKRAFDAEEQLCERSPEGTIVHATIRIGDAMVEMGEAHGEIARPMATHLHLFVADADAVYRRALEAGGISLREPGNEPYGQRVAAVRDPAGNSWYIATPLTS